MDIKPLNVSLVKQDPKSDDCLRCCALMVFNYFKVKTSKNEIWRKLKVYKKQSGLYGAYYTDLGRLAMSKELKAKIIHSDWQWWGNDVVDSLAKGKMNILGSLESLMTLKKKKVLKKLIAKESAFVKEGGKFEFRFPSLEFIDSYLRKGIPIVLSVRGEVIGHDPEDNYEHAIVVFGKPDKEYLIRDPEKGKETMQSEELLFGWDRTGGWAIVLEKTTS